MIMNIVEIKDVSKKYDINEFNSQSFLHDLKQFFKKKDEKNTFWAVKDIGFNVEKGESLGIIGRNGAGKSTLLKILSRITSPTTGHIKIKGMISSLLEVGTGFHPELTGKENIYLNGAIMGMSKREIKKKLDNIIDFAGVEKFIDTPVKRYSSGMRVRLGFSVAAHLDSDILIVDEVLAVGDIGFQNKCLKKMNTDVDRGKTVIFVSHNMTSIRNICSRGIVLKDGMIAYDANIDDAIKRYIEINCSEISPSQKNIQRTGSGRLRFRQIDIRDSNGEVVKIIISGSRIVFELHYVVQDKGLLGKDVEFSFAINDLYGDQLLHFSNDISNQELFYLNKLEGVFMCSIPKFPLVSGIYNINVFSRVAGEITDWIMNCNQFTVVEGDFYSTGRNKDNKQGKFLSEYSWSQSN